MRSVFGIRASVVVAVLLCTALLASAPVSDAKTVEELKEELAAKREELKTTEEKIQKFKEDIQLKRKEARTLADQITLLDDDIVQIENELQRTGLEIEKTDLQVQEVRAEIDEREAEIKIQKDRLAAYIRQLHEVDQQSTVTVLLKYNSFSEAVQEADTFNELQNRGQETLVAIQHLRDELEIKRRDLEDFQQTLEALEFRQEQEQSRLATQRDSKERILDLTNQQEAEYQELLKDAQATHQAAQSDIGRLDTLIREELKKQGLGNLPSVGQMSLPVPAEFGYSCVFHCAGYPYAYLIGPHSGLDIPASIGTPIRAPADGYVARTHDSGGPGYSYIMVLHGDNVTTVYGHVSGFAVNEGQLVTRGTIIGYTGGAPGMHGAGLSSGPHLHWEVRVNNVPQDPEKFL